MYVYIYIYTCVDIHTCRQREREREREIVLNVDLPGAVVHHVGPREFRGHAVLVVGAEGELSARNLILYMCAYIYIYIVYSIVAYVG